MEFSSANIGLLTALIHFPASRIRYSKGENVEDVGSCVHIWGEGKTTEKSAL